MLHFKVQIILLNIVFFFSLSAQAHECVSYFKTSDFMQKHDISLKEFNVLENLVNLEVEAFQIENVISKSIILEEVMSKLAELVRAGGRVEVYMEIRKLILKEITRSKEFEKKLYEQELQFKDSKIDGKRAIFHRIEPGTFLMGENRVPTEITQAFDMMATQTTQIIWREVAALANRKLAGKYAIKLNPSHFKGDTRPVESVSLQDIQIWISALNELSQLGEPALAELISGHKKGDEYKLPTEAQWEFVIRGRCKYNDIYHFGKKESDLDQYAWFEKNSGGETHPVAKKQPLVVDGDKEFFDMHGNVWEVMADRRSEKSTLPGGRDPIGTDGKFHAVRGGSWGHDAWNASSNRREGLPESDENGFRTMGFRLSRVIN